MHVCICLLFKQIYNYICEKGRLTCAFATSRVSMAAVSSSVARRLYARFAHINTYVCICVFIIWTCMHECINVFMWLYVFINLTREASLVSMAAVSSSVARRLYARFSRCSASSSSEDAKQNKVYMYVCICSYSYMYIYIYMYMCAYICIYSSRLTAVLAFQPLLFVQLIWMRETGRVTLHIYVFCFSHSYKYIDIDVGIDIEKYKQI